MAISNLIPGVSQLKLIAWGVAAAGVVVLMIWIGLMRGEIKDLRNENVILAQNNKVLQENNATIKKNLDTVRSTNEENLKTIIALEKERDDAKKAVAELAKKEKSNIKTIGELKDKLEEMEKNPANNGALAPALRETIRGIQETGRAQ